ncbi:uncharacterized protein LOC118433720 [Folsomia candida]|uniref:uncharacterized protein LOC118433720 n=1 Tax=Folsomia candida TaxID=158441 RepID=UPI001604F478|nr:uncharacterized protein LOC118433720 [Folsomia candida]
MARMVFRKIIFTLVLRLSCLSCAPLVLEKDGGFVNFDKFNRSEFPTVQTLDPVGVDIFSRGRHVVSKQTNTTVYGDYDSKEVPTLDYVEKTANPGLHPNDQIYTTLLNYITQRGENYGISRDSGKQGGMPIINDGPEEKKVFPRVLGKTTDVNLTGLRQWLPS